MLHFSVPALFIMKIRKATLEDVPTLAKLGVMLAKEHKNFSKRVKIKGREKRLLAEYKKEIKNPKNAIFVAIEDNKIVGYIECFVDDSFIEFYNYPRGFIGELYVLKSYRRKSVGEKLLNHALKWFKSRKLREVRLEVFAGNHPAIKLYEKKKFKIKKYIMEKTLR